jgi:hypothetical protein
MLENVYEILQERGVNVTLISPMFLPLSMSYIIVIVG